MDPLAAGLILKHMEKELGSIYDKMAWCQAHNFQYHVDGSGCPLCGPSRHDPVEAPKPADPVEAHVTRPAHYTRFKIEPITFCMENGLEFWRGNIIKYVARAGHKPYPNMDATKSEVADLRKAARMIEMRLNQLEGKPVL